MSGNLNIDSVLADEYKLQIPMSCSSTILRKSALRIYPTRAQSYAPFATNWIEFYVSSPTEVAILDESYFTFDIIRNDTDSNGNPSTQYDDLASLDFAGVHCLIKTFQVKSGGTNVIFSDNQYYHLFTNIWFKLHEGRDQTDHNSVYEGRSMKGEYGWNNDDARFNFYLTGVNPTASTTAYWYSSFDSGDSSYSLILPALSYSTFSPALTASSSPVLYSASSTYTSGQTVLYNSSSSPIAIALYPNSQPTGSTTTLPVGLNNNQTTMNVVLPSIWVVKTGQSPASGTTPNVANSVYWTEIPFSSIVQNNNIRKDVQSWDVLSVECYVGGTAITNRVVFGTGTVIAVDQLTGIIILAGSVPTQQITNLTTAYTTTRVNLAAEVDMTLSLLSPAYIKAIRVAQRPHPFNQLPGRMEIVRYNGFRNRVLLKVRNPFMKLNMPMYVLKSGFVIRMELEFGQRAMVSGKPPLGSQNPLDYTILDPRFVVFMSAPEPSVMRDVITKWNSADGLIYSIPDYTYREISGIANEKDTNLVLSPGVRSARGILLIIQPDQISSANTALANAEKVLSTYLRTDVRSFQVNVGAHQFPVEKIDFRENNQVPDFLANEGFHLLSKLAGRRHYALRKDEFRPWNTIYNSSTSNTVFLDSTGFIIYVDLARANTSNAALTGTDVSITPVMMHIERGEVLYGQTNNRNGLYAGSNYGGAPGIPLYRFFILHDKFLRISSNVITTLQ